MADHETYTLPIPKSRLLKVLASYHQRFCCLMPDFFELPRDSILPVEVCLNEHEDCHSGLFEINTYLISINPRKSPDFQEARFTVAHESGHYLHCLKQPEFYQLPNLLTTEGPGRLASLFLIISFRELVADMASFEFLRLENLLAGFLDKKKREVLDDWERIDRTGDYRRESFGTLTHYHVYKESRDNGKSSRIMTASCFDLNLLGEIRLEIDEGRKYLSSSSCKVERLNEVCGPPEPMLFD